MTGHGSDNKGAGKLGKVGVVGSRLWSSYRGASRVNKTLFGASLLVICSGVSYASSLHPALHADYSKETTHKLNTMYAVNNAKKKAREQVKEAQVLATAAPKASKFRLVQGAVYNDLSDNVAQSNLATSGSSTVKADSLGKGAKMVKPSADLTNVSIVKTVKVGSDRYSKILTKNGKVLGWVNTNNLAMESSSAQGDNVSPNNMSKGDDTPANTANNGQSSNANNGNNQNNNNNNQQNNKVAVKDTQNYNGFVQLKTNNVLQDVTNDQSGKVTGLQYSPVVAKVTRQDNKMFYKLANGTYVASDKVVDDTNNLVTYDMKDTDTLATVAQNAGLTMQQVLDLNKAVNPISPNLNTVVLYAPQVDSNTYDVSKYASGDTADLIKYLSQFSGYMKSKGLHPSVMIAQAIVESQSGESGLAVKSGNLFGIKGTYKGRSSSWSTKEDYGGYVTINADFRTYPSWAESVLDYYTFLNSNSLFKGMFNTPDYLTELQALGNSHYATSTSYVSALKNAISRYNLTALDK